MTQLFVHHSTVCSLLKWSFTNQPFARHWTVPSLPNSHRAIMCAGESNSYRLCSGWGGGSTSDRFHRSMINVANCLHINHHHQLRTVNVCSPSSLTAITHRRHSLSSLTIVTHHRRSPLTLPSTLTLTPTNKLINTRFYSFYASIGIRILLR